MEWLLQEAGPQKGRKAKEAWAAGGHRWFSSKWRGEVSQGQASRLLTEIKRQETLRDASEGTAVSGRRTWLPWLPWEKTRHT